MVNPQLLTLQWTIFSGTDEMTFKLSQQNLYVTDTSLQRTSLLCPKSHYSLEHPITGPIRNIYTFYFRHCLTVSFKFSSIFSDLFWSIKKIAGISSQYSPPWLTRFPVANTSKAQRCRDRNIDTTMEISVAQRQPSLFHTENQYELQQKHSSPFFSTLLVGSFTHCQVAFKLSNKHTLQYIVIKLFFLPTADS